MSLFVLAAIVFVFVYVLIERPIAKLLFRYGFSIDEASDFEMAIMFVGFVVLMFVLLISV